MADFSHFEFIITNPGLDQIGEKILFMLDFDSLINCQIVSKAFNSFINPKRNLWIKHLDGIRESYFNEDKVKFYGKISNFWMNLFPYVKSEMETDDCRYIVQFLKKWYNSELHIGKMCPIDFAVLQSKIKFIRILAKTPVFSEKLAEYTFFRVRRVGSSQFVKNLASVFIEKNFAPEIFLSSAYRTKREDLVLLLYKSYMNMKIDINKPDKYGDTPLHKICFFRFEELFKLIAKEQYININAVDNTGSTPVMIACHRGCYEIVRYCLEHTLELGIDWNQMDRNGRTPLHQACLFHNVDIISLLLANSNEKGINIVATDLHGNTPLQIAENSPICGPRSRLEIESLKRVLKLYLHNVKTTKKME